MSSHPSDEDAYEETLHFQRVISTYRQYAKYTLSANNRRRKDYLVLPSEDRKLLDEIGYRRKLQEVDDAILENKKFLDQIVSNPDIFGHDLEEFESDINEPQASGHTRDHGQSHHHSHDHSHSGNKSSQPTESDLDKLRSTLKQFVRDWSEEGAIERDACYKPMITALLTYFANVPTEERGKKRVLVPGAGLGRLAFDVASLGFACQGNEFSHYMLLASYFMLNRTTEIHQHTIYPYVHSFSNLPNKTAMLRPIKVPDVLPSSLPPGSNFSLVAGDFEEIYGGEATDDPNEPQSGQWDAILTCFFIDTAKNFVNYLRIIHKILMPGGVWINLGPLLWHWENNMTNDISIELDLEEVKTLIAKMGFKLSNEAVIDSTYTNNSRGMLGYTYQAAFWIATKED